jgi:DNA-binding transcriptional LysR family regulator
LTQLAVTKVIHEFESCFGGALFARSNRGVVPTELGLLLDTLRIALMPRVAAQQFEDAGLLRILDLPESGAFGTVGFRCVRIESRARPVRHLSRV